MLHAIQAMPGAEQLNDLRRDVLGSPCRIRDDQLASRRLPFEHRATATAIGVQPATNGPKDLGRVAHGCAQQHQAYGLEPGGDAVRRRLVQHMALLADVSGDEVGGLLAD
ncbi:hypothetical protein D3C80_1841920 [compost metagenome]